MPNNHKLSAKGIEVKTSTKSDTNYLCLTDIAKYKNAERPDELIRNWLRNRNTIEFLGIWEQLNNEQFNPVEFDGFKNQTNLNAPTGQLYASLGQRPRKRSSNNNLALKGRSKICPNPSQKTPYTSFSQRRNGDHPLMTKLDQISTPTWQRFLKTWNVPLSLSIPSRIMFMSYSYFIEPLRSLPPLETSKNLPQNGLKHKLLIWRRLHGKLGSVHFPLANLIFQPSENTSRTNKNITARFRFKMSCVSSWKNMGSIMMNGISGIRSPFQGLGSLVDCKPRALPWAGIGDTVGVFFNSTRRAESLEVKLRPNGATYTSLGQRPRKDAQRIDQALKGRSNAGRRWRNIKSPFQGLGSLVDCKPRALPWAGIGDTVGVFFNPNSKLPA